MNKHIADDIVSKIRELYRLDHSARRLLDATAHRKRDAKFTNIEWLCDKLDISRGDAVALARALDDTGCGEFIVGRRGQTSRFRWEYSCISLGKVASGEQTVIEEVADAAVESDDDEIPNEPPVIAKLSIADAKQGLANYFGVATTCIEIKIIG